MKRQIKFRGWNKKNNKWLYGYVFPNRGKFYIIEDGLQPWNATPEDFLVDEDSIGECTGEKDKKGNDIYEGDILASCSVFLGEEKVIYIVVEWSDDIETDSYGEPLVTGYWFGSNAIEVVGNIYDNPELISR